MLFKVDENLPQEVALLLRQNGHDAVTVPEQGLAGAEDSAVEKVFRREKRALVTLDQGFADIRTYPPKDYSGLIVLRLSMQDKEHVLRIVEALIPMIHTEPLARRLWIVDEGEIRIRE